MRLIDADKAEKQFAVQYCESCNSYNGVKCRACEARDGADVYADMPTIDAVPVIRCKDCKHSEGFINDCDGRYCNELQASVSNDYYCAYGASEDN